MRLFGSGHARGDCGQDEDALETFTENEYANVETRDRRARIGAHRVGSALFGYALPNQDGNYGGGGQAKAHGDNRRTALLHLFHPLAVRRIVAPGDCRNGLPFTLQNYHIRGQAAAVCLRFFSGALRILSTPTESPPAFAGSWHAVRLWKPTAGCDLRLRA